MLAAMTHPSRVLNLDMKAKALYAKELYLTADSTYIYTYFVSWIHVKIINDPLKEHVRYFHDKSSESFLS